MVDYSRPKTRPTRPFCFSDNLDLSSNKQDCLTDYENINATHAANPPYPYPFDDDTDTSDDDVQLNYAQVTFTANPGHQRSSSDSSSTSSGEDEIQYSDIKIWFKT